MKRIQNWPLLSSDGDEERGVKDLGEISLSCKVWEGDAWQSALCLPVHNETVSKGLQVPFHIKDYKRVSFQPDPKVAWWVNYYAIQAY